MAYAVIGANWGDEGKGLAVDAISARLISEGAKPVVVRSNGGGQAGHTVLDSRLGRHIFSQVGSGFLAGARSHMSKFFVFEPTKAEREVRDLKRLSGIFPELSIDPRALVTTPWDMMINQAAEMSRGKTMSGPHGSCGMGFGETIERSEKGFALTVADLHEDGLESKLRRIMSEWAPQRMSAMAGETPESMKAAMASEQMLRDWVRGARSGASYYDLFDDAALGREDEVIFEGAQGLALDMFMGEFPHVTRSRTGAFNMSEICREAGIGNIDILYMTRAYATRHGAGPMPYEGEHGAIRLIDPTNIPNAWQGSLRSGGLDAKGTGKRISADIDAAEGNAVMISARIGISCVDQLIGPAMIDGMEFAQEGVVDAISRSVGLDVGLVSRGPSREDVTLDLMAGRDGPRL